MKTIALADDIVESLALVPERTSRKNFPDCLKILSF